MENKTSERFDRAIKALVKGFFNETLAKGSCAACAVGNIVAECIDYKLNKNSLNAWSSAGLKCNAYWGSVFTTTNGKQRLDFDSYIDQAKENINSTGYTIKELAKIEYAFETNTQITFNKYRTHSKKEIMEDQYNGLMAVVDVLCEIEGINPTPYKELFKYDKEDFQPINQ